MSRLLQFPNPRKRRAEACAWIARIDAGLSDADRTALTKWLGESEQNVVSLLEMGQLWDEMDLMDELAELFPLKSAPIASPQPRRRYVPALALTGLASMALAGVWALLQFGGDLPLGAALDFEHTQARSETLNGTPAPTSLVLADGTAIHETAIGGQGTVRLEDGTTVALNTNTRIAVRYSVAARVVMLERGEATFDVAHEPARPFDVHAGDRVVQAVGTVFNVQLGPDNEVEVAVTEGRVRVLRSVATRPDLVVDALEAMPIERVLLAGDAYFTSDSLNTLRKLEPEDLEVQLAWQRGMLIFRGEPLDEVLLEVSRYTTLEFQLADPELAEVKVGGYFRVGEIDRLLVALQENFGIQATQSGSRVILSTN
jgi:transmembrane sensor